MLRITGLVENRQQVAPVECDFDQLVQALGIEVPDDGPFLVFGGTYGSSVEGGSRDFRGAYRDLADAKVAFTELRLGDGGWGEVVRVEKGKLVQKCWFGQRERKPGLSRFRRGR